ncbi:hypothetical protein G7046_g9569 [Stylonectria norvegica]|nr:hypothetical protein G7046_g9569 [Stylonectria norvegica]
MLESWTMRKSSSTSGADVRAAAPCPSAVPSTTHGVLGEMVSTYDLIAFTMYLLAWRTMQCAWTEVHHLGDIETDEDALMNRTFATDSTSRAPARWLVPPGNSPAMPLLEARERSPKGPKRRPARRDRDREREDWDLGLGAFQGEASALALHLHCTCNSITRLIVSSTRHDVNKRLVLFFSQGQGFLSIQSFVFVPTLSDVSNVLPEDSGTYRNRNSPLHSRRPLPSLSPLPFAIHDPTSPFSIPHPMPWITTHPLSLAPLPSQIPHGIHPRPPHSVASPLVGSGSGSGSGSLACGRPRHPVLNRSGCRCALWTGSFASPLASPSSSPSLDSSLQVFLRLFVLPHPRAHRDDAESTGTSALCRCALASIWCVSAAALSRASRCAGTYTRSIIHHHTPLGLLPRTSHPPLSQSPVRVLYKSREVPSAVQCPRPRLHILPSRRSLALLPHLLLDSKTLPSLPSITRHPSTPPALDPLSLVPPCPLVSDAPVPCPLAQGPRPLRCAATAAPLHIRCACWCLLVLAGAGAAAPLHPSRPSAVPAAPPPDCPIDTLGDTTTRAALAALVYPYPCLSVRILRLRLRLRLVSSRHNLPASTCTTPVPSSKPACQPSPAQLVCVPNKVQYNTLGPSSSTTSTGTTTTTTTTATYHHHHSLLLFRCAHYHFHYYLHHQTTNNLTSLLLALPLLLLTVTNQTQPKISKHHSPHPIARHQHILRRIQHPPKLSPTPHPHWVTQRLSSHPSVVALALRGLFVNCGSALLPKPTARASRCAGSNHHAPSRDHRGKKLHPTNCALAGQRDQDPDPSTGASTPSPSHSLPGSQAATLHVSALSSPCAALCCSRPLHSSTGPVLELLQRHSNCCLTTQSSHLHISPPSASSPLSLPAGLHLSAHQICLERTAFAYYLPLTTSWFAAPRSSPRPTRLLLVLHASLHLRRYLRPPSTPCFWNPSPSAAPQLHARCFTRDRPLQRLPRKLVSLTDTDPPTMAPKAA